MWKYLLFLYLPLAWSQSDQPVKWDELAGILKESNLEITEGASRVYNSRQRVRLARASLLPKLNVWRLSSVLIDWKSAGEIISQDLVPFLVPANWQRVKQEKIFAKASEESFHGLLKNTILHAKLLYLQLQQDSYQKQLLEGQLQSLVSAIKAIEGQIVLNPQLNNWYRELSFRKSLVESDLLQLQQLIWEERQQLSLGIALPVDKTLLPEALSINDPNFDIEIPQSEIALQESCEIKIYDHLLKAAPSVKKEIQWSVLGVSDISRGANNGIFDSIPVQDGLGFGMGASIKVHKKQVELFKKQKEGTSQVVVRQTQNLAKSLANLQSENDILIQKIKLVNQEIEQMRIQSTLGSYVDPIYMANLNQKKIIVEIEKISLSSKLKMEQEKLMRIYGQGDYKLD